jgi:soluble lytic murein transglycosylase-like protein
MTYPLAAAWLALGGTVLAQRLPEGVRRAMEASVARQSASIASMRISIATQRAAMMAVAAGHQQPSSLDSIPPWPASFASCDRLSDDEVSPLLKQAAQEEGVGENLLRAVAEAESGFRACAVSPKGAMGLMQLMPATASEMGVHDAFDPQESLLYGAHLLKLLLERFNGNAALALAAYNAGPGRVEEAGGIPPISETQRYVREILGKLP